MRTRFQNITGRDLPCEAPETICPCQSIPEFNNVLANATGCDANHPGFGTTVNVDGVFVAYSLSFECGHFDDTTLAAIFRPVTPEEAAACSRVILDAAASRGLACPAD